MAFALSGSISVKESTGTPSLQSSDDDSLFHYTDKHSAEAIKKSGCIKKSTPAKGDARFGPGVYLTSYKPSAPPSKILQNNWDGVKPDASKMQAVFEIPKSAIPGVAKQPDKDGRDIWLYPGDICGEFEQQKKVKKTEISISINFQ